MAASWMSAFPYVEPTTVGVSQCLPGYLLAAGRHDVAREILVDIAAHARDGLVLAKITTGKPDVPSTLWFARAAYMYRQASNDSAAWQERLLPAIKAAVQSLISTGPAAFRMDDGGMLAPKDGSVRADKVAASVCPIGLNALWYFMLSLLAEEMHALKNPSGDHFERLAGRFRRSFAKSFWCSAHGFLCDPELQKDPNHAAAHGVPDPEQLLIATLPFSPIPRTKQRQIVLTIRDKSAAPRGVIMPKTSREGGLQDSAAAENTASALHLAWLVESLIVTSDTPARAAAECRPMLPAAGVVARFYVGNVPAEIAENVLEHAPSTAETARARQMCGAG